ncbi:hypothetical protein Pla52n_01300 [Stieleria varia]|uniref:Tricarballylate dehydrogenase n=2 Tax=Stieleria varia TaxID=2528005 RepID=A0A5C6B706_9BACT|nr:hypothetical protein Pla52n_01300 [Stieleria varia]
MVAAAQAAKNGAKVTLLEKNSKTGVKILMSGGTRCNLTHQTDAKGIAAGFGANGRFLQRSVGAFGPRDVVQMFNDLGVATKVESTGKIFPSSDRALDVRNALQHDVLRSGVELRLNSGVERVQRDGDGWSVMTGSETVFADRLIVTAGGRSWPKCGTSGDAYQWLSDLGHTIVPTRPALVPLVGGLAWTHDLSGLTLEDCEAFVYRLDKPGGSAVGKPLARRRSSWLFTHFGFSGPVPMDVSGTLTAADSLADVGLRVDLLPDVTADELTRQLSDRSGGRGRRTASSILREWLPQRLADAIATQVGYDGMLSELPKRHMQQLVTHIKQLPLPVNGTRGFAKAEVTAGGVSLGEVDPKTMASRIVPGLYIAGEVLDLDGWIGGYNFQAAFSTGRAAGIAASLRDAS